MPCMNVLHLRAASVAAVLLSLAGASLAGAGIVIEKGFQDGGRRVRSQGIRVESLAIIKDMSDGHVQFAESPYM